MIQIEKNKNKIFSTIKMVILVFFLVVFLFPQIASADALSDKRRELDEINRQIEAQKKSLDAKSKERQSLQNQVAIMDGNIRQTELSIQGTQNEIDIAQAEISKLKTQINLKEKELAYQKEVLNETIRVVYEETDQDFLETILSSNNISDLFSRTEYLGAIEDKISYTMTEITRIKIEMAADKKEQEKKKAELVDKRNELQYRNAGLSHQKYELTDLLSVTKGQEAYYQKQVEAARQAEIQVSNEITYLINSRGGGNFVSQGHVNQGNIIGYQDNSGSSTGSHLHFEVREGSSDVNPRNYTPGRFRWPLDSFRVSQEYGCTDYASGGDGRCYDGNGPYGGAPHMGIDLVSFDGAPVKAAGGGEIIFRKYYGGYGNAVLVWHGGNLFTLYGHMR